MKKLLPIFIILSMLMTSCTVVTDTSQNLTVYASFYAMEQFVRVIGGEDIVYHSVVPLGGEPHDFEPTAADMAKISKADVFVYSGGSIDAWAKKVTESLPESVETVCAGEDIDTKQSDPHVWLSFDNAKGQLEKICMAFSAADSENAQKYRDRLASYTAEIDELESEYRNANLAGMKLFVTHGAYGYLCDEFGMEQIALEGTAGDSDPSPAQMADIVERIKAEGAKCIFYDPIAGDKTAKAVASEADIEALPLYTFEGDSEHRDYITIMRLNLEQLKAGL